MTKETKVKLKEREEKSYPQGIENKVGDMTVKDLEIAVKMLAMNSGQNQIIRSMGFEPFQLPDVGDLVKRRK